MEDQFVPYKQSLKLKELGFDNKCLKSYRQQIKHEWHDPRSGDSIIFYEDEKIILSDSKFDSFEKQLCEAPLWQQAFDWLQSKLCFEFTITCFQTYKIIMVDGTDNPTIYEFTEIVKCLDKLIEIAENTKYIKS